MPDTPPQPAERSVRELLRNQVVTIVHGETPDGQPIYASGVIAFPDAHANQAEFERDLLAKTIRDDRERLNAFYRDVRKLAADFGDPGRNVIAAMPFGATLDQVACEIYGIDISDEGAPGA
jgi:hypothetical protein